MDIVARLKTFINYMDVPVTQFADTCRIPRPTLSQLLNGRNKKVSDELIGKIHEAYPQLSVLWLMFGEGNMLYTQNIQTSEPQNGNLFDFDAGEEPVDEHVNPRLDFENSFENEPASSVHAQRTDSPTLNGSPVEVSSAPINPNLTDMKTTVSFDSTASKKIVNIIVYYSDNSFESFVPSPDSK